MSQLVLAMNPRAGWRYIYACAVVLIIAAMYKRTERVPDFFLLSTCSYIVNLFCPNFLTMALMHGGLPLPIHAPIPPDRYFCHRHPSKFPISPLECQWAVNENWPDGRTPIRYYMKDPRPSDSEYIPNHVEGYTCRVSIETAGPREYLPDSVLLEPHKLRGLAGYVIQKCAAENQGLGGSVTIGLTGALAYIHNPINEHWGGNFLTISIRPRFLPGEDTIQPGSQDRNIAAVLSAYAASIVPHRDSLPHNAVCPPF